MSDAGSHRSKVPALTSHEVHAWLVQFDSLARDWSDWAKVLSPEETAKSDRFHQPADRLRSGATRALLRRLLAGYMNVEAASLRFVENRFGKPAVAGPQASSAPRFSVSHSGDFALLGFVRARAIGVDIEQVRNAADLPELTKTICNPREMHEISFLPEEERPAEVMRYWTLKEAYVKALGVGLSFPYQNVKIARVDGSGTAPTYRLHVPGRWAVMLPPPIPGYASAVVTQGVDVRLRVCSFADAPALE